jgi:HD superfamily phosphodiesterase
MPGRSSSNKKKIDSDIINKAYNVTTDLLENQLPDTFRFHTVEHMKEVLKYVQIIGSYHHLNQDDMNILEISAIFHDIGYIKIYKGHEREGIKIARDFLEKEQVMESQIIKIEKAIMSTKVPQKPENLLSKILCDADLINLTYDHYFETAELMRQEWINTGFAKMNELEFHNNSLNFFKSHNFHTEYAQKYLQPKKKELRKRIQKRMLEIENNSKL